MLDDYKAAEVKIITIDKKCCSCTLKILLNSKEYFNWATFYQNVFHELFREFKNEALLTFFGIIKKTDAHETGRSTTLAQNENISNAKRIVIVC